ncbi:trypsin-2 isoform X2 [Aedes aegypti]|uniref:Peptidase S1 domain-containing protein n=1 Tax=Aedes aegypti TaxID=7159 RepID=A0A1S4FDJ6_AEDAE|nr:trypsin-2 isoform X2 [Aedes aegypti]
MIYSAIFVILPSAVLALATIETLPDPLLVGGTESRWGSFPSAAFIRTPTSSYCGAAVIHPEFVLTIAQCVFDSSSTHLPAHVEVIAGDLNMFPVSVERQTRTALEIIAHHNFTSFNLNNDIALLRVDQPFTIPSNTVELAVRRKRIVPDEAECLLPGWGIQRATTAGFIESRQKYLTVEILNRDKCNEPHIHQGHVRESMLCGGNLFQSSNAACSGNLGSPLYCDGQLAGLLSFGTNCGLADDPPVFSQVRYFNRWIDGEILKRVVN